MPGLHFDITASNDNFKQRLQEVRQGVEKAAKVIDGLNSSFDTSTAEGKLLALMNAIRKTENVAERTEARMQQLQQEAEAAVSAGDTAAVEEKTRQFRTQTIILNQAIVRLRAYREALDSVQQASGDTALSTPTSEPTRFFKDQSDYKYVQQLHAAIRSLQADIAKAKDENNQEQIKSLNARLEETTRRLQQAEDAATKAASRLGTDLGGRAAETSAKLYELNSAVKKQEDNVKQLSKAVAQAKAEYDRLSVVNAPDSAGAIDAAKQKVGTLTNSLRNAKNTLADLKGQQKDAKSAWSDVNREIKQHDSIMVKMLGGQEKFKTIMAGMPPALQSATAGISGMTGAARAFIATPLGAILAAIILAVKALTTWFHSSAEGEMAFAQASGYVSGILNQLKEVAIWVGKALYEAFTNSKQAVSDLWEAIKENLVNRLEGVAGVVVNFGKGLWNAINLDFDAAGDSFKQMGNDILKTISGVDDMAGKTKELALQTHEAAKANAELNVREKQLHRNRREWSIEEQKIENEISELRLKAQRGDMAANTKAQQLIKQKYDRQIAYQQEELDIIRKRNSLTTNSDEDYDKEAEAQKKLLALEAERNHQLSFYNRKDFSLGNQAETLAEKQRNAQAKLGQELAELQRRNDAEAIEAMDEGTEKKLRQIDNDYTKRRNEIAKQEASWRKENKAAGNGEALNAEQRAALDEATELNEKLRQKAIGEVYQAEFDAMRDNLRQYGDYQQQKLAIATEYAEKLNKASSEGERRSLERERDSALAKATTAELKDNIDWQVVFGEFGGMFRDVIEPVLADAKEYIKTDEFKNADHDSQQALIDAILQMEASMGKTAAPASFSKLGADIEAYRNSMEQLHEAQNKYKEDYTILIQAQQGYKTAMQSGSAMHQAAAKATLDAAQANADASAQNVQSLKETADAAQSTVTQTATTLKQGMEGVLGGLQKLSSGSANGVYEGFIQLGKGAEKLNGNLSKSFGKFADKLANAPVVGWIASLLDVFKDGLSDFMVSLIDAVIGAASNILSDVLSGDFAVNTAKSLVSGVGKIFDTLTFGVFKPKGNSEQVEDSIDRLTEANKRLEDSMDGLTKEIKAGKGMKSVKAYQQAVKNQQQQTRNKLDIAREQAGYHSANHSWNATHRDFTWQEIEAIRNMTGAKDFNGDIFSLTPEQMKKFRDTMPELWKSFFYSGDSDNYADRLLEKIEDYIGDAGKLDKLRTQLTEALTGITFDSMYGDFVSKLSDMEYAASDAADDISEMFYKAMLANKIGELYSDDLESWYKDWGKAMEKGMSEQDMERLQEEYQAIVEKAIEDRDAIAAATGYDRVASKYSQKASAGGFEAMGEDTGKELNGRFTAVAESNERIADSITDAVTTLLVLSSVVSDGNTTLHDILSQVMTSNGFLSDVVKHTKPLLKLIEKMDKIIANTKYN